MRPSHTLTILVTLGMVVLAGCAKHKPELTTGLQHLQQQQYDEAHDALLAFADASPDHEDAALALYTAARIRILHRDQVPEGETLLEQVIERYPTDRWAFHAARRLVVARTTPPPAPDPEDPEAGEPDPPDPALAVPYCDHAVRIGQQAYPPVTAVHDPLFAVYRDCAAIYTDAGQPEQAEPLLAEMLAAGIVDHRQMPPVHAAYGDALVALERPEEAAEVYAELVRTYPYTKPALALIEAPQDIVEYEDLNWDAYRRFAEGAEAMRTWAPTALDRLTTLDELDAPDDLRRHAASLLPWVHLFDHEFARADEAYAAYLQAHPAHANPPVLSSFAAYSAAYRTDFEYHRYLTDLLMLSDIRFPDGEEPTAEEYEWAAGNEWWYVVDLAERYGYYDHAHRLNREPVEGDRVYLRFDVRGATDGDTVWLDVDTDDPYAVWLDGKTLAHQAADAEPLALALTTDWSEVLIRLQQVEGPMVSTLRLTDEEGGTVEREVRSGPQGLGQPFPATPEGGTDDGTEP